MVFKIAFEFSVFLNSSANAKGLKLLFVGISFGAAMLWLTITKLETTKKMIFNAGILRGIRYKMMKLTTSQIQRLSEKILAQWKSQDLITFKSDEKIVLQTIKDCITKNILAEDQLDKEIFGMIETLQNEHGEQYSRGKMFPILKQKLAKERKFIL